MGGGEGGGGRGGRGGAGGGEEEEEGEGEEEAVVVAAPYDEFWAENEADAASTVKSFLKSRLEVLLGSTELSLEAELISGLTAVAAAAAAAAAVVDQQQGAAHVDAAEAADKHAADGGPATKHARGAEVRLKAASGQSFMAEVRGLLAGCLEDCLLSNLLEEYEEVTLGHEHSPGTIELLAQYAHAAAAAADQRCASPLLQLSAKWAGQQGKGEVGPAVAESDLRGLVKLGHYLGCLGAQWLAVHALGLRTGAAVRVELGDGIDSDARMQF